MSKSARKERGGDKNINSAMEEEKRMGKRKKKGGEGKKDPSGL